MNIWSIEHVRIENLLVARLRFLAILVSSALMISLLSSKGLASSIALKADRPSREEFIPESLSDVQKRLRLEHAQELLGRHYGKSLVRSGETIKKINSQIYRWTRERLPARHKKEHAKIAQTIIDESLKYGFDPVFLLSVIQSESRFNPEARGGHGEIGLMQILPPTGEWIAEKAGIKWKGSRTLEDNIANIKLGAAYFAFLRDRFDMHARLYIAAYNMGQRNVDLALDKKIWPKDYPGLVMKNYVEFYSTLNSNSSSRRTPAVSESSPIPTGATTSQMASR